MKRNGDLSEQTFDSATFDGEDWGRRVIVGSEFIGCTFVGVTLAGADLRSCRFIDCTFAECDLAVARLSDSSMSGCTFEDCRMSGIDWTRGGWNGHQIHGPNSFTRCELSMGVFDALDLVDLVMVECKVHDASFRESRMSGANLEGSDLTGADFTGADLSKARLVGVPGIVLDPRSCDLTGVVFDLASATSLVWGLGATIE